MTEGKRPLATGFFFSLGHSSVVIVAVFVVVFVAAEALWRFAGFEERFGKVAGPT